MKTARQKQKQRYGDNGIHSPSIDLASRNREGSAGNRGRRRMSAEAEAKARIAAAQRARWARVKAAQKEEMMGELKTGLLISRVAEAALL